jgi:hypothetical protein
MDGKKEYNITQIKNVKRYTFFEMNTIVHQVIACFEAHLHGCIMSTFTNTFMNLATELTGQFKSKTYLTT